MTLKEAIAKAESYCAYQERAQHEVRLKLLAWGIDEDDAEGIIVQLITTNFLNEERFAVAFASGKFKIKRWGRKKIAYALRLKKVSEPCIKLALEQIDDAAYWEVMSTLAEKKMNDLKGRHLQYYQKQQTVVRQMAQRGFEPEFVLEITAKLKDV